MLQTLFILPNYFSWDLHGDLSICGNAAWMGRPGAEEPSQGGQHDDQSLKEGPWHWEAGLEEKITYCCFF